MNINEILKSNLVGKVIEVYMVEYKLNIQMKTLNVKKLLNQ